MAKKRVLSGIRASGRLHLGNYLGAVKGMLALQEDPDYETFYMVADMHGLTTPYDIETLRQNRREVIIDYLAAGLDPEKSVIFSQADTQLHGELAFYLSSVMTVNRMQDLPTYKDKVKQFPKNNTMALLNYPILMTADILAYKANLVPVGIDQEPHLEMAREIARKMKEQYGLNFPEPERFKTEGEYIPSLTGDGKMSKSVEGSYINITDDLETIKRKIAGVPTDAGRGEIRIHDENPTYYSVLDYEQTHDVEAKGVQALMILIGLFEGKERREEYEVMYTTGEGVRYGDLKQELAEAIYEELKPLQEKRKELENNPEYVEKVIAEGQEKARAVAEETLKEVRKAMGLS